LELKAQGVKLITPEVKKANPSLFAAACKKHFYGTWKKALKAALRLESVKRASAALVPEVVAPVLVDSMTPEPAPVSS
jgi:hypothetical protein